MGAKFLDRNGFGSLSDAISAIEFVRLTKAAFAATNGANVRVLSNSWSGGGFSQMLLDEINSANAADMLFVAAAGNASNNNGVNAEYPASYTAPNVVAVAATDNTDILAWFSNYGGNTHLAAPGVSVLSTLISGYGYFSGTSMATPHVSGAAALVLSKCALNTAALKSNLLANVDVIGSLAGKVSTSGRLNVDKAIRACALPAAPTGLTAAGTAVLTLAWSATPGVPSYNVKRSTPRGGPYALLASGIGTPGYSDAAVTNGTTYYYVVSGVNALGEGPNSSEASATPGLFIAATAGSPQNATVGTAFPSALQATVQNASSTPVPGVTVTFTAPANGASASFGGLTVATAVTNASGIATSPLPTANGVAGGYGVVATAPGAVLPVSFSLTNVPVPTLTASGGTPQSTIVNTAFGAALTATVLDGTGGSR